MKLTFPFFLRWWDLFLDKMVFAVHQMSNYQSWYLGTAIEHKWHCHASYYSSFTIFAEWFLSTPVLMHGGLICTAFCPSVWCHLTRIPLDQNSRLENNSYLLPLFPSVTWPELHLTKTQDYTQTSQFFSDYMLQNCITVCWVVLELFAENDSAKLVNEL